MYLLVCSASCLQAGRRTQGYAVLAVLHDMQQPSHLPTPGTINPIKNHKIKGRINPIKNHKNKGRTSRPGCQIRKTVMVTPDLQGMGSCCPSQSPARRHNILFVCAHCGKWRGPCGCLKAGFLTLLGTFLSASYPRAAFNGNKLSIQMPFSDSPTDGRALAEG